MNATCPEREALRCGTARISRKSNSVLAGIGSGIQWVRVTSADKIYCVYRARARKRSASIAEAAVSANRISRVTSVIDPTTAH